MPELPLEAASKESIGAFNAAGTPVSAEEQAALPILLQKILERQGLSAPPVGVFRAHHYTRWKLLCMLRARGGDVDKAADRALECIAAMDLACEAAKAYEAAPVAQKDLRDQWLSRGIYGRDRRGAPVYYVRMGREDVGGFVREAGIDFHIQQEWYATLVMWDALLTCSVEAGVALQGMLFVIDLTGISLSCAFGLHKVSKKLLASPTMPGGEHPMPEGGRKFIVLGAPRWVSRIWALAKRLVPARTLAKVSIFSESEAVQCRDALLERIAPEQLPAWLGGSSTEPWPYGSGGDVPCVAVGSGHV